MMMDTALKRYVDASEALADAAWGMTAQEDEKAMRNPEELRKALEVLGKLGTPAPILVLIRAMIAQMEAYQALPQQETRSRTLDHVTNEGAEASGVTIVGKQRWQTVCKAYSAKEGWFKTTKVLRAGEHGVLIQVTTREANGAIAEALAHVPGVRITENGDGTVTVG